MNAKQSLDFARGVNVSTLQDPLLVNVPKDNLEILRQTNARIGTSVEKKVFARMANAWIPMADIIVFAIQVSYKVRIGDFA